MNRESKPHELVLTGDAMLGRLVDRKLFHFGPEYPWGGARGALVRADLTIVNLECLISGRGRPWSRWPKIRVTDDRLWIECDQYRTADNPNAVR